MRTYRIEIRLIQLSVFLSMLVVIAGFFGLWGNRTSEQAITPPQQQEESEEQTPVLENTKIVTLGDSFTFGYPGHVENAWPVVMGQELQVEVVNKGKTFQNSQDLYSRFDSDVLNEKPGRVIIFAGNGDALQDIPLETFQQYIQAMVEKAESNHIEPILALPLPYKGVQNTIKEFREWEFNYAKEKKIIVLDFATVLMDVNNVFLEGLGEEDGKYPTKQGYRLMGEYAARVLR